MKENNINVLDELNKGCCMGVDALNTIIEKVEMKDFKKILEKQYNVYEDISEEINDIYDDYSDKEPHETSTMNKMMTWEGIQMKTITDSSNSKLAEITLQGLNMGIIEGKKMLNHKDVDKEISDLVKKYIDSQEKTVEKVKEYL